VVKNKNNIRIGFSGLEVGTLAYPPEATVAAGYKSWYYREGWAPRYRDTAT
jgi:hypothetical protein